MDLVIRSDAKNSPRQNSLALALREIGRLERTLFTLAWIEDPSLIQRPNGMKKCVD